MNLTVRPNTYVSQRKPWAHQKRALDKMYHRVAFALLMAMRTGKTKTLLDDWGTLEAEGLVDDLLVIAPAGVYRTWEVGIKDHLATELLARTEVLTWSATDKTKGAIRALEKFMSEANIKQGQPRILLVNIEALSNVDRARLLCMKFCMQRKVMIAIDEATAIKNYKAKRTKFCNKQLKPLAEFRRILTGLPTPKSPLDLYPQFEFLDNKILGYSNPISFRARYAVMKKIPTGGRWVDIVVGYRDVDQLYGLIEPHSSRVKLEDCYDLPPKIYQTREVRMTDEQERIYRSLKEFATAELEANRHVSAQQVITQILRMHQVLCGHTTDENGRHVTIPENRTSELIDLLEEYDGKKAIIWCSYDHDVRKVSLALEKLANPERKFIDENSLTTVARFWGGNRGDRENEEQEFLNNPECRFMVATAAAGGRGRTWTNADLVVYYSNTADLEHRSQSEERAQGVDKTTSVLYVDLVVPGTVDMKMLQTLRKKINMSGAITNDGWREWVI
jgi:SNF2 family DNA or RNA helicase